MERFYQEFSCTKKLLDEEELKRADFKFEEEDTVWRWLSYLKCFLWVWKTRFWLFLNRRGMKWIYFSLFQAKRRSNKYISRGSKLLLLWVTKMILRWFSMHDLLIESLSMLMYWAISLSLSLEYFVKAWMNLWIHNTRFTSKFWISEVFVMKNDLSMLYTEFELLLIVEIYENVLSFLNWIVYCFRIIFGKAWVWWEKF